MTQSFRASELWNDLQNNRFDDVKNLDIFTFREPGQLNNRLASWDPYEPNSYRYYKNILFNLITSMPKKFFVYYKTIGDTFLGNPVHVTVNHLKQTS